jgi:hypothetical protein
MGFSMLRMLCLLSDELEEVEHDVASKECRLKLYHDISLCGAVWKVLSARRKFVICVTSEREFRL